MTQPTTVHSTFVIERSYPVPPEKVFAAFADPAKKRHWFGDSANQEVEQFDVIFKQGGTEIFKYRLNDKTPFPGVMLESEGYYQEISPDRRIVTASAMSLGGRRISAALVTIELLATDMGTDLICTHQGAFFEGSDGPQMREGGWRSLFDKLERELAA